MAPVGLPAITTPLRVSMRACVRFGSIVLSCTWSQHTKIQEVDTSLSKSLLLAFGTLALSLKNQRGTKTELFGLFDLTSRVRKVMNVVLSTSGSGAPGAILSYLTSP